MLCLESLIRKWGLHNVLCGVQLRGLCHTAQKTGFLQRLYTRSTSLEMCWLVDTKESSQCEKSCPLIGCNLNVVYVFNAVTQWFW